MFWCADAVVGPLGKKFTKSDGLQGWGDMRSGGSGGGEGLVLFWCLDAVVSPLCKNSQMVNDGMGGG